VEYYILDTNTDIEATIDSFFVNARCRESSFFIPWEDEYGYCLAVTWPYINSQCLAGNLGLPSTQPITGVVSWGECLTYTDCQSWECVCVPTHTGKGRCTTSSEDYVNTLLYDLACGDDPETYCQTSIVSDNGEIFLGIKETPFSCYALYEDWNDKFLEWLDFVLASEERDKEDDKTIKPFIVTGLLLVGVIVISVLIWSCMYCKKKYLLKKWNKAPRPAESLIRRTTQ